MEKQEEKKPRLLVFGSSVARGAYANNFHGWAYLLEKQLEDDWEVINFSESGSDTKRARQRLDIVKQTQAKVVIISLSLANEGFNNPNVVTQFTTNLRKLVDDIQAMKSIVVVGGVYPNGFARQFPWMYDRMKQANAIIAQWSDVDMIDFMSTTNDGDTGAWREGEYEDPSHPNTKGHKAMFEAIDLSIFDNYLQINCE